MLRRLLMVLVAAGLAWAGRVFWRRYKAFAPPDVPDTWAPLTEQDAAFAEALDLRGRIARIARQAAPGDERTVLLREVHQSLEAMAGLVRVRLDLEEYLRDARGDGLDRLRARAAGLASANVAALEGLRGVYAELVGAVERRADGGAIAVAHTRAVIDDLRQQAEAEREVRAWLAREAG